MIKTTLMEKLQQTYQNCQGDIGRRGENPKEISLLPILHDTKGIQAEIRIDLNGNFKSARALTKDETLTIIPATEKSMGRSNGIEPHPFIDSLVYVAQDYPKYTTKKIKNPKKGTNITPFEAYHTLLKQWCDSEFGHPIAQAVLKYVEKGTVVKDLIDTKVLFVDENEKLLQKWNGTKEDKPAIFSVISDLSGVSVRWSVIGIEDNDKELWNSWIQYYMSTRTEKGICHITGKHTILATDFPKNIRYPGDTAKMFSSNDDCLAFRGRFFNANQVFRIGLETLHQGHNALRRLISRQSYKIGDAVFIFWSTFGEQPINPLERDEYSQQIEGPSMFEDTFTPPPIDTTDTGLTDATKEIKWVAGYPQNIDDISKDILIAGFDSVVPGRLATTFFKELCKTDFDIRVKKWHSSSRWIFEDWIEDENKKKTKIYHKRAPLPSEIVIAAYGKNIKKGNSLWKKTIGRIALCIIEGQKIPRDVVESVVRRASQPMGKSDSEIKKDIAVACGLWKNYTGGDRIMLDLENKSRDYLWGRLLGVLHSEESFMFYIKKIKRPTSAQKLQNSFSLQPYRTFLCIDRAVSHYKQQIKTNKFFNVEKEIMESFNPEEFKNNSPLTGEYLLGFYAQIEALRPKENKKVSDNPTKSQNNPLKEGI